MNDEAVILEDLLLRLSTLNSNPVLPNSNRTFCFPLTDKDRKALGDCIYKYLGEHYPESPFAIMRNAVKEAKGKPKPTNFDNITASPETLAMFIVNPENHFCSLFGCPFNMNGERLCDYEYESCEECATAWLNKECVLERLKQEAKTED